MRYLHTMLRVRNLDAALDFYCNKLGLTEVRRRVDEKNKYTLVFLAAAGDWASLSGGKRARTAAAPPRSNSPTTGTRGLRRSALFRPSRLRGRRHLRAVRQLMQAGVTINRPPRDGMMAFVRSPDRHSIELLQKGAALPPKEPWVSMPNTGHW